MSDEILIEKLSKRTNKSKEEIEMILESIDTKYLKWVNITDSSRIVLPTLIKSNIVSNFLIIKVIKTLFKKEKANKN